jgi:hypothetical protein
MIREIIEKNYRPLPGNPHGVMITTTLEFASSIEEEEAKSLVNGFRNLPQGSWSLKLWYTPLWDRHEDDMMPRPAKARLMAGSKNAELLFADERLTAWLDTLSPAFADDFGGLANRARWVNILGVRSLHSDSPLALCFPIKRRIADFPKLRTLHESLVSREGIVLFQQHKDWRDLLEWVRGREAIIAWLDAHRVEATPSDAGRTAAEIIKAVGNLHGVQLFAHEETIRKLDDMASRRVREGEPENANSTKEYPDRTASVEEWKALVSRRSNKMRFRSATLDDFVKANVFRLGLAVPCTHCQKTNWYGLDDVSAELICVRCLSVFPFPQGGINPKRTPWHYRVVGPFSVPDFASGGYATALTLRLFARGLGTSDVRITYATGLDLKFDQVMMEVDFVLWFQNMFRDSKEPVTLFGEAKSFAEEAFSRRDIDRLKALAHRFPGSFLVLSCLKNRLSKPEKDRIRKLAEWGRLPDSAGRPRAPVIVLLGDDLFLEWHLPDAWKTRGGKFASIIGDRYIDLRNLRTLADITQRAYLDMPSYFEWLRKRYEGLRGRKKPSRAKAA